MNGEGVDTGRQFARQNLIDHTVTLKPALTFEGLCHDIDPEVRLPTRSVPGVAFVFVRLVLDPDAVGRQSLGQLSCDDVLDAHADSVSILKS
jgi:hypothetical protein